MQSIRLALPYSEINNVKQLLGNHVIVESVTVNDIILDDDRIVVDVVYKSVPLSEMIIHYPKLSEMKQLFPNSDKYVTKINECLVQIQIKEKLNVIPIHVRPLMVNNNNSKITYYGLLVTNPLTGLTTPVSGYFNKPEVLYPKDFKAEPMYDLKTTIESYKRFTSGRFVSTDIPSWGPDETCYVIPFEKIPKNISIPGEIIIQPRRIYNYVLYIPSRTKRLSSDELELIDTYIECEKINFLNFMYMTHNAK